MNGTRGDAERERLDAALIAEEVVLGVAVAKTIIPSTKGLLSVSAACVLAGRMSKLSSSWARRSLS